MSFALLTIIFFVFKVNILESKLYKTNGIIQNVTILGSISSVQREISILTENVGAHTIMIEDLPSSLDENSVRITGKGRATLIGTEITSHVMEREQIPKFQAIVADIKKSLDILADENYRLGIEDTRLRTKVRYLENLVLNSFSFGTKDTSAIPLDKAKELLLYEDSMTEKLNSLLNENSVASRVNHQKNATLIRALEKLFEQGVYEDKVSNEEIFFPLKKSVKTISLKIKVPDASESDIDKVAEQKLVFSVNYMTGPASWIPDYDLRFEGEV